MEAAYHRPRPTLRPTSSAISTFGKPISIGMVSTTKGASSEKITRSSASPIPNAQPLEQDKQLIQRHSPAASPQSQGSYRPAHRAPFNTEWTQPASRVTA